MTTQYVYSNLPWMENATKITHSGRVLVSTECKEDTRLELYNVEGAKLPVYLVYIVLKIALGEGWIEKLEKLHLNRKNRWKIEVAISPAGETKYLLYTMRENSPVCSSIVTVANSQIETFSILSEDAAPLLKEIIQAYPPVFLPRYKNYRYTYFFPTNNFFYTKYMNFLELPGPIKKQREETESVIVHEDFFLTNSYDAGKSSGIIETIEALKCMEVLLA